jgi:hypothetical protein
MNVDDDEAGEDEEDDEEKDAIDMEGGKDDADRWLGCGCPLAASSA